MRCSYRAIIAERVLSDCRNVCSDEYKHIQLYPKSPRGVSLSHIHLPSEANFLVASTLPGALVTAGDNWQSLGNNTQP